MFPAGEAVGVHPLIGRGEDPLDGEVVFGWHGLGDGVLEPASSAFEKSRRSTIFSRIGWAILPCATRASSDGLGYVSDEFAWSLLYHGTGLYEWCSNHHHSKRKFAVDREACETVTGEISSRKVTARETEYDAVSNRGIVYLLACTSVHDLAVNEE
ncbi:hypothetical protein J1614_009369 [Plenodomus biglobosus]|nr:hypothetical protein J1614_009369 [Plenodomus biglobosus]